MTLFDANTWLGHWPFAFLPEPAPSAMVAALRREKIGRALVSPLGAVFAPEPGPANAGLLRDTARVRSLVPVPVINPTLANWHEELDRVAADPRVRAVRWLPAYHDFRLTSRWIATCVHELQQRGLRLVVTARLVDERHEYFALRIKGVPTADLGAFLERHPDQPVLVTGLYYPDLRTLAPKYANLLADFSFAEWDRTLERLLETVPARQLVFGSHTPFLVTAASAAKLATAQLSAGQRRAISAANLERFLRS